MDLMPSASGFTPEIINSPDTITAFVAAWHEPGAPKSSLSKHRVSAYGVVFAGRGHEGYLWGCSYARHQPPLLAHGVLHLFREKPRGTHLRVHAIKQLGEYVGPEGYIWERRDIKGSQPLLNVAKRLRAGEWTYVELDEQGQGTAPFASAARILETTALPAGREHHWDNPPASTAKIHSVFLTGP